MEGEDNKPVATVESLQAELTAEQNAHQSTKESLEAEQTAHESTKSDLAQAAEIIDGQKQTIDEQAARIIELQTNPSAYPTITVGKVDYEVQAKSFKYKGTQYTVAEFLADAKLQKELVSKKIGFLVKKEG